MIGLFALSGVSSGPRPTAVINGVTFEPGEELEVKVAGGRKVLVRCEKIDGESVVVMASNQRLELRLRGSF